MAKSEKGSALNRAPQGRNETQSSTRGAKEAAGKEREAGQMKAAKNPKAADKGAGSSKQSTGKRNTGTGKEKASSD